MKFRNFFFIKENVVLKEFNALENKKPKTIDVNTIEKKCRLHTYMYKKKYLERRVKNCKIDMRHRPR